jgi:GAF domain-containing protein
VAEPSETLRLGDSLAALADDLVVRLAADACAISRVIGDVLILVAERVESGATLQQGQGYLVSDFPQTDEVLQTGEPRALTLDDVDLDAAEAAILRQHDFGALLMLPLELNGERWGLVEVYRRDRRPFDAEDIRLAQKLSRLT